MSDQTVTQSNTQNIVPPTKGEVIQGIRLGESHFREFKSALKGIDADVTKRPRDLGKKGEDTGLIYDISEALVAFANADGGMLLVGVEDKTGEITGVPHTNDQVKQMLRVPNELKRINPEFPEVLPKEIRINELRILLYVVAKSQSDKLHELFDGRCVIRKDAQSSRILREERDAIELERSEASSTRFCDTEIPDMSIDNLDITLLEQRIDKTKMQSIEGYLYRLGLVSYSSDQTPRLQLRKAAVLLYGEKLVEHMHQSTISIYFSEEDAKHLSLNRAKLVSRKTSNIFDLHGSTQETLHAYFQSKNLDFPYPEEAVSEALINALAHRDYLNQGEIEILVHPSKLTIKSPGAKISSASEQIVSLPNPQNHLRNKLLVVALKDAKLMNGQGTGFDRIRTCTHKLGLKPPDFEDLRFSNTAPYFVVTFHAKSLFSSEELEWLKQFSPKLSTYQKQILLLGRDGRRFTKRDILKVLELANDKNERWYGEVNFLLQRRLLLSVNNRVSAIANAKTKGIESADNRWFVVSKNKHPINSFIRQRNSEPELWAMVKNLTTDISKIDVRDTFSVIGNVVDVQIPNHDQPHEHMGYMFVRMETAEKIQEAIAKINGKVIKGQRIEVTHYDPKTRH